MEILTELIVRNKMLSTFTALHECSIIRDSIIKLKRADCFVLEIRQTNVIRINMKDAVSEGIPLSNVN